MPIVATGVTEPAPRLAVPVQLLHERYKDEMMLLMTPSHINSPYVFKVGSDFRQKRGNGILTTSGLINGIFGEGPDLHVARWESVKVTDRFEECDDDGVTTIRERERFTQCLTLVYSDGSTAILQEEAGKHEECTSSDGDAAVYEGSSRYDNRRVGSDGQANRRTRIGS